ncbi:2OG-Fe(II) oxygenase family protein [Burkholderia stagnalis]
MKLLHYLPSPADMENIPEGFGAHADYRVFTILAQDDVGGFELVMRAGESLTVRPLAGAPFVDVGDQLSRWTGGRFHPTIHRVFDRVRKDRYSIAFFSLPISTLC